MQLCDLWQELGEAIHANRGRHVFEVEKGPFKYFVFPRHVVKEAGGRRIPEVDPAEAAMMVEMLTLPPNRAEVDGFLIAEQFLIAGHLSFKKPCGIYDKYAVARVDLRRVQECKENPMRWHGTVVDMIPSDASLNNTAAMGCEYCIAARWLCGDDLANPLPSPIASEQAVRGKAGAPQRKVLGNARMSEDAAAAAAGQDDAAAKRSRRQVEAEASKRARTEDHSPPRSAAQKLDASVAQDHHKKVRELVNCLRAPSGSELVQVKTTHGPANLWAGARAEALLKTLQLTLRQIEHLPVSKRLGWRETCRTVPVVYVLSIYKLHPVMAVNKLAADVSDELRVFIARQIGGEATKQQDVGHGGNRCLGQEPYVRLLVPDLLSGALLQFAHGLKAESVLLILGRRTVEGFLAVQLWQPNLHLKNGSLYVDAVEHLFQRCAMESLVLLGMVVARQQGIAPLPKDVVSFADLASRPSEHNCLVVLGACSSSSPVSFFALRADELEACKVGGPCPSQLQAATFVDRCAADPAIGDYTVRSFGGKVLLDVPGGSRDPFEALKAAVSAMCAGDCGVNWGLRCIEAGGLGDCLFAAIAAGLQAHVAQHPAEDMRLRARLKASGFDDKWALADLLRKHAAHRFARMEPEELVNVALTFASRSRIRGMWYDSYSPTRVLGQCGLEDLLGVNSVMHLGANEDGAAGDVIMWAKFAAEAEQRQVCIHNGTAKLKLLREKLWGIHAVPCRQNGWHWGTEEDVVALSLVLNLGFVVFADVPKGAPIDCMLLNGSAASLRIVATVVSLHIRRRRPMDLRIDCCSGRLPIFHADRQ